MACNPVATPSIASHPTASTSSAFYSTVPPPSPPSVPAATWPPSRTVQYHCKSSAPTPSRPSRLLRSTAVNPPPWASLPHTCHPGSLQTTEYFLLARPSFPSNLPYMPVPHKPCRPLQHRQSSPFLLPPAICLHLDTSIALTCAASRAGARTNASIVLLQLLW